eukprot:5007300-Prymnesium_polylepis.1
MSCKHICHVAVSPTRAVSEDLIEIVKNFAEHCCSLMTHRGTGARRHSREGARWVRVRDTC